MDQSRRHFQVGRRLLLGTVVLLGAGSAAPVLAGFDEIRRDWRDADRARYRRDMREAAQRRSEGAARARRDSARSRRESRIRAEEFRRDLRERAAERRDQMRRLRAEIRSAMREMRLSLKAQRWRCRDGI